MAGIENQPVNPPPFPEVDIWGDMEVFETTMRMYLQEHTEHFLNYLMRADEMLREKNVITRNTTSLGKVWHTDKESPYGHSDAIIYKDKFINIENKTYRVVSSAMTDERVSTRGEWRMAYTMNQLITCADICRTAFPNEINIGYDMCLIVYPVDEDSPEPLVCTVDIDVFTNVANVIPFPNGETFVPFRDSLKAENMPVQGLFHLKWVTYYRIAQGLERILDREPREGEYGYKEVGGWTKEMDDTLINAVTNA